MTLSFFDTHPQRFYLLSVNCRRLLSFESPDHQLEQDVEDAFSKLPCRQGGNVHAEFEYDPCMLQVMDELSARWKDKYLHIQQLPAFMRQMKDGEMFIRHQSWAPMIDLKRSLISLRALRLGIEPSKYDTVFVLNWGRLYLRYDTYSYGFLTDTIRIGEEDKDKRVCRFCNKAGKDMFTEEAHAIMDALGNKLLFCNEECDQCNSDFQSQVEKYLFKFLEITRTLFSVSGKGSRNHHLEGENFHIHPDPKTFLPIVYIKQEHILNDVYKGSVTGKIWLYNKGQICYYGIYKSLVKIALDMIPSDRISHFKKACEWVHGDFEGESLPPYYYGEHHDFFSQPELDLFFSNEKSPKCSPYCTAVLYIFNSVFVYTIPYCDKDGERFKNKASLKSHWDLFLKYQYLYVQEWVEFDSNDKEMLSPIYKLPILSQNKDYNVVFKPSSDEVFKIVR